MVAFVRLKENNNKKEALVSVVLLSALLILPLSRF